MASWSRLLNSSPVPAFCYLLSKPRKLSPSLSSEYIGILRKSYEQNKLISETDGFQAFSKIYKMANEKQSLVQILTRFRSVSENPETYLQPPSSLIDETREVIKRVFDFSKKEESKNLHALASSCPIQELIIDNFDDEQIWQEIELQNEPVLKKLTRSVRDFKKISDSLNILQQSLPDKEKIREKEQDVLLSSETESEENSNDEQSEGSDLDLQSNKESSSDNMENENGRHASKRTIIKVKQKSVRPKAKQSSVVDDKFFKLSEMEEFLNQEDRRFELAQRKKDKSHLDDDDDASDAESVDYFAKLSSNGEEDPSDVIDDDDDDDGKANIVGRTTDPAKKKKKGAGELRYTDYFDPPGVNIHRTSFEDDESDEVEGNESMDTEEVKNEMTASSENDEIEENIKEQQNQVNHKEMSSYEKKQFKIKQNIEKFEKENLAKKPWQLLGEAGSSARPMNSLLQEDLTFDHTTVTAPEITEETTKSLEDVIKQRIKDTAWDDVERKQKPTLEPFEYKKRQPLNQEKSKLSLSQIYEQEFLKQTQAQEEEENEAHKEIKNMMTKLFTKLDALSNFHFTPKPPKPEVKVVTNVPSIAMEEVAPVAVSDAMLLAPEEIHEKKADLKGDTEKTETDRKRERRAKKLKQRQRSKEKEKRKKLVAKLNPGLGNVYSKKDALKKLEKGGERNVSVIKDGKDTKALKSSSAFFSQLEDQVKQTVKAKKEAGPSKKKKAKMSTSHLKL